MLFDNRKKAYLEDCLALRTVHYSTEISLVLLAINYIAKQPVIRTARHV